MPTQIYELLLNSPNCDEWFSQNSHGTSFPKSTNSPHDNFRRIPVDDDAYNVDSFLN